MSARETFKQLRRAADALERAHGTASDEYAAHYIEKARKANREALRRARDRLKDVDLDEAEQGDLLDPGG